MKNSTDVIKKRWDHIQKSAFIIILISCVVFITSCSSYSNGCGNPTGCWKKYYVETPCGTYIKSPCEPICKLCTFNDPACQSCWACINHDGCTLGESLSCKGKKCPDACISSED